MKYLCSVLHDHSPASIYKWKRRGGNMVAKWMHARCVDRTLDCGQTPFFYPFHTNSNEIHGISGVKLRLRLKSPVMCGKRSKGMHIL